MSTSKPKNLFNHIPLLSQHLPTTISTGRPSIGRLKSSQSKFPVP